MVFEWDDAKHARDVALRGVGFDAGATIFAGRWSSGQTSGGILARLGCGRWGCATARCCRGVHRPGRGAADHLARMADRWGARRTGERGWDGYDANDSGPDHGARRWAGCGEVGGDDGGRDPAADGGRRAGPGCRAAGWAAGGAAGDDKAAVGDDAGAVRGGDRGSGGDAAELGAGAGGAGPGGAGVAADSGPGAGGGVAGVGERGGVGWRSEGGAVLNPTACWKERALGMQSPCGCNCVR